MSNVVNIDSSGRIRLSSSIMESAGFRPEQNLAVVAEGKTGFKVIPASKAPKNGNSFSVRVEQDGRARVLKSKLRGLGVSSRKRNFQVSSRKGVVQVSM